jgi:hypothetical protein
MFDNDMRSSVFYYSDNADLDGGPVIQERVRINTVGQIRNFRPSSHRPCHQELVFLNLTDSLLFATLETSDLDGLFPDVGAFCRQRLSVEAGHEDMEAELQVELWFNTSIKELHFLAWFACNPRRSVMVSIQ